MTTTSLHDTGRCRPAASQPGWRGDLPAAASFFVEQLGWPVDVDRPGRRLILRAGGVVDALILPGWLAQPVAADLATAMLCGPVSAGEDGHWWTFFTGLCQRSNIEVPPDLRAAKVHAIPRGGLAVLPPATVTDRWPNPPGPGVPLPPWSAVVATSRRVLDRNHRNPPSALR